MAWLLAGRTINEPDLANAFFLSVRKALCLANGFESKCKFILAVIALTDAVQTNSDIDASLELARRMRENLLGETIRRLGNSPVVDAGDTHVLLAAKDARNYIAHQSAEIACDSQVGAKSILKLFDQLRQHVGDLARGDNLVSSWCFEISEKEPAPSSIKDDYVESIINWIFEGAPLNQNGQWEYLSIAKDKLTLHRYGEPRFTPSDHNSAVLLPHPISSHFELMPAPSSS